jgi:integrase
MFLSDYVEAYLLQVQVGATYANQLRCTVRVFDRWLGRTVRVDEMSDDLVNRWILWLQGRGLSPATVRNQRGNLLALWRSAFQDGMIENEPKRIRKVRVPDYIPVAFSEQDATNLLLAAAQMRGFDPGTGLLRSAWWRAFVLTAWDTALRLGDLLTLTTDEIRSDGLIVRRLAKTGRIHAAQLSVEAMNAIEALNSPGPAVFPLGVKRDTFYNHFRKLAGRAGVTGTSKFLRRGSATACEKIVPGSAMAHLGHKTPGLAYKHYVDPRQLQFNRPTPPPLTGAG